MMTIEESNKIVASLWIAVAIYFILPYVFDHFAAKNKEQKCVSIMKKKKHSRDSVKHNAIKESHSAQHPISDATDLVQQFKDGVRTCRDVMLYSIKRSHDIGKIDLAAVTEEFYDDGLDTAASIDNSRVNKKLNPKPHQVLLGVPVSIKDSFDMKGADNTLGCAARCFKPASEDGILVRLIRDAGGIPFVRSNIPQLLMMPESENGIWGVACNPWDVTRTPGGSSGGEGALIASHCSVVGLGSDIGTLYLSLKNSYFYRWFYSYTCALLWYLRI